jgi:pyruvate dehydrogenase E2 component (dihydrolipoamide acetyltransferase)
MSETAIIAITMPKFGLAMTEGKVAAWAVPEGAQVSAGDELADIETSKITNAYESPVGGILRRRVAIEQQDLPVGALLGVIADPSVPDDAIDAFVTRFQAEFAAHRQAAVEESVPEPQTITAGGRTIRYLALGDAGGTPVVLIHGFGGDLNSWMFNQPMLAAAHRTVALDLPGHGGSDKQVGAGDVAALAMAVVEMLEALGIARAHLVGHSLGGAVALDVALREPALVASVSLVAPAGLGPDIDVAFIEGFIAADRRKTIQPVLARLFVDASLVSRDMAEDVLRFKRLDGATAALSAIAAANFPGGRQALILRDRINDVAVPVQVIWGAGDAILPAHHAGGLPASVVVHTLEQAGHMPHMERAGEVNRLLLAFLAA